MNTSVLYDTHPEGYALITLNRPERRNAIDDSLIAGLSDALREAAQQEAVRAIVLTGAGAGFCAGADLAQFEHLDGGRVVHDYLVRHYRPLIEQFVSLPKPIIGAINGYAAGAGASLALACDLRVMAHDASLLQAFSNIGLVPDAGSTWFLARQIGYSRAYELAIEGKPLPAGRCLELGLCNRVVEADDLVGYATTWAAELAARPTVALGLTKRIAHHAVVSSLGEVIELEASYQAMAIETADHAEGLAAFAEKRTPRFEGK